MGTVHIKSKCGQKVKVKFFKPSEKKPDEMVKEVTMKSEDEVVLNFDSYTNGKSVQIICEKIE